MEEFTTSPDFNFEAIEHLKASNQQLAISSELLDDVTRDDDGIPAVECTERAEMAEVEHVTGVEEQQDAATKDQVSVQQGLVSLNLGQDAPAKPKLVVKFDL